MTSLLRLLVVVLLVATSLNDLTYSQDSFDPAEEVLKTITSWRDFIVSKVSNKLDELTDLDLVGKIIDATIEEDCEAAQCSKGYVRTTNPNYLPETNGCGSFGLQWKRELLPAEDQEQCCDLHDLCYDKCGSDKEICDLHFKKCLYRVCREHQHQMTSNQLKACKGAAKLMFTGTQAFGCKAYLDAQEKACQCVPETKQEL